MLLHVPHTLIIPFGPSEHWEVALDLILVLAVYGMWEGLGVLGENNILVVKKLTLRDVFSPRALLSLLDSNPDFTTFPLGALEKWR